MKVAARRGLVLLAVAAIGCGGTGRQRPTVSHPLRSTNSGSQAQRAALTDVVAALIKSYEDGQPQVVCNLFQPRLRQDITARIGVVIPRLRGETCAAMINEVCGDPKDQPPAINEASKFEFKSITVAGRAARIVFPDGRRWRFVLADGRWLITELPFLPPSIQASFTSGSPS